MKNAEIWQSVPSILASIVARHSSLDFCFMEQCKAKLLVSLYDLFVELGNVM